MSDVMNYARILSHGKIEDLSAGFKKEVPFSVYVRPLNLTMERDLKVSVRCVCDTQCSEIPVPLNDWTPAAIVEIAPNAIDLSDYEVFWGAGNPKN